MVDWFSHIYSMTIVGSIAAIAVAFIWAHVVYREDVEEAKFKLLSLENDTHEKN